MSIENSTMNVPTLSVKDILKELSGLYINVINANMPLKAIPTPFLWGPAGIGKSEAVLQLADAIEKSTGKKVNVTDVRLLLFSPVDLRGVPVADEEKRFSNWLMPKIFDMKAENEYINILFLDELSAAPQSVQASAYQICLDRRIGEHKLPDNCIVIAAGNRTTDQSVSFKMPKALCNRMLHFNCEADYDSWREWAIANNIDSRIIGYLGFDSSRLCVVPESSETAYPTPRSWAFVSSIISAMKEKDLYDVINLISGCIGNGTALEFVTWTKVYDSLPNVSDVFGGYCTEYPKTYDALHAFTSSLVSYINRNRLIISTDEIENVCAYVKRFPADFAMMFYQDINQCIDIKPKLSASPSFRKWLSDNKNFI